MSTVQARQFDSDWDRVHDTIISHRAEALRVADMAVLSGTGAILDLACGTGKHLIELAKLGHRCVGVERLSWKLDKAREQSRSLGLDIEFLCADMRDLPVTQQYDLVLCLYAMSSLRTHDDILAAFHTARRALRETGAFVFNIINREANIDPRAPVYDAMHAGYLQGFTLGEVRELLEHAHFVVRATQYFPIAGIPDLDLHLCSVPEEKSHEE